MVSYVAKSAEGQLTDEIDFSEQRMNSGTDAIFSSMVGDDEEDEKRKKEHGEKLDIKDPITESYTEVAKEILSKEFEEDEFNLENKLYDKGDIEQARDYNLRKIRGGISAQRDIKIYNINAGVLE